MNESRTLLGRIRTFMIVTLITIMVWLLAESRMVQTRTLDAQIDLQTIKTTGDVSLVVRQITGQSLGESQGRTVTIELEGSTASLDRFDRHLQNRIELRVGREIPAVPGFHTLDLRMIMRESSELGVRGLSIADVSPATIIVEVDELVTQDFPVRVMWPKEVVLDGVPRSEPESIRVTAPKQLIDQVRLSEAQVRVDSAQLSQLAQGRLETVPGVVVELPGIDRQDWGVDIEPGQVDVYLTLRTQTENLTIDRLPVQVLLAPGEIGKWQVEIAAADKDLINIEVSGAAEAIEQLRSSSVVPRAFISLTFEELERGIRSKPARILGLPNGCRVVSPDTLVNFEILRIDPPALGADESALGSPTD